MNDLASSMERGKQIEEITGRGDGAKADEAENAEDVVSKQRHSDPRHLENIPLPHKVGS